LSFRNKFLYITVIDIASDFIFGKQLGFPIIESHQKKKWVWPWARGAPYNFGFPFNFSTTAEASDFKFGTRLGFSKAHHKITPRGKVVVASD